jgi:hypothetical protein
MELNGNSAQNACFEARMPTARKINVDSNPQQVEEYLRDKYEHKIWYKKVAVPRAAQDETEPKPRQAPAVSWLYRVCALVISGKRE